MDMYDVLGLKRPDKYVNETHAALVSDDAFGIEVEVERAGPLFGVEHNRYWNIAGDGSLRNDGCELKFKKPLWGQDAVNALGNLHKVLLPLAKDHDFSDRTSVHIHVDIRDLTPAQLSTYIYLYLTFEPLLTSLLPPKRQHSEFCVPLGNSRQTLESVGRLLSGLRKANTYSPFPNSVRDTFAIFKKYAAMNMAAARTFGSLEFRQLFGTGDPQIILSWVNTWLALKVASRDTIDDLHDIALELSRLGPDAFTRKVLGDERFDDVVRHVPANRREHLLYKGVRNAQYVSLAVPAVKKPLREGEVMWVDGADLVEPVEQVELAEPDVPRPQRLVGGWVGEAGPQEDQQREMLELQRRAMEQLRRNNRRF